MLSIARVSSVVGAVVWVLGLPIVGLSAAVVFASDAAYFWFGVVAALVGLATTPVALTYAGRSPAPWSRVVRGLGLVACTALVLTGALLVAGSSGWLGDRAPSWIPSAAEISLTVLFVWVPLASYSSRRSTRLGRSVFWLGMLAGGSFLVLVSGSVLIFYLDPAFVITNATIPVDMVLSFLVWLGLPAWLTAFAVRVRGREPLGADTVDATTLPPPVALG